MLPGKKYSAKNKTYSFPLPEYADDLSKSEFLREIGLMKTLGYHERLVNMLACVTQSEPYCLVVEYCSDG